MTAMVVLLSLLACSDKDGMTVENPAPPPVESPPVEGPRAGAEAAAEGALSWEAFGPVIMSVPDGDGPTEIRQGNRLVGMVFRPKDSNTEYIYMANQEIEWTSSKFPHDPAGGGLALYPSTLSPKDGAFAASHDPGIRTVHERLLMCADANCSSLVGVPVDTWEDWTPQAFETEVQGILAGRFDPDVTLDGFIQKKGDIMVDADGRWPDFNLDACKDVFHSKHADDVHADGATVEISNHVFSTRQFTEKTASEQIAMVVLKRSADPERGGIKHHMDESDPDPSEGQTYGDAWCAARDSDCSHPAGSPATCKMVKIVFTDHPPPTTDLVLPTPAP